MEVFVKRFIIFLFIAVLFVGSIFAQERGNRQREVNSITIEGTVKLERGIVAVESGSNVYYVPLLTRYIGFINELKEGVRISVEGIGFRNFIHPAKITIDSKSYDFPRLSRAPEFGNRDFQGRMGEGFRHDHDRYRRRDGERPERNNPNPGRRNMPGRYGCDCGCSRVGRPA